MNIVLKGQRIPFVMRFLLPNVLVYKGRPTSIPPQIAYRRLYQISSLSFMLSQEAWMLALLCGQFSMSITRCGINSVIWAIAYQQIISEHLSEGVFWISWLSFELYSFYCVHNSTISTVDVRTRMQSLLSCFVSNSLSAPSRFYIRNNRMSLPLAERSPFMSPYMYAIRRLDGAVKLLLIIIQPSISSGSKLFIKSDAEIKSIIGWQPIQLSSAAYMGPCMPLNWELGSHWKISWDLGFDPKINWELGSSS